MEEKILAKDTDSGSFIHIENSMWTRHGMIAGATGTGKTVTVRVLAEQLSELGVPIFLADVKGDLSGIAKAGESSPKLVERQKKLALPEVSFKSFPVSFWDVFGEQGIPFRVSVSELGPTLFSRLLELNEVQSDVLQIAFTVADREGLFLVDLKDLRSLLQYVSENAKTISAEFGNVSATSVASIQRGLLALEGEGATIFFGEPAFDIKDFLSTAGQIHILAADKLLERPKTYATLLVYLLSEMYEYLPEVGDIELPKFVFFFDEAHLIFEDCPDFLLDKIEQVVRLIRSKGVGVYFISQSIADVPAKVLGQLGNRIQHAVRAFTDKERKNIKGIAENFHAEGFNVAEALTSVGVGEAVVSLLDKSGKPSDASRALIVPPKSRFSPLSGEERKEVIARDRLEKKYRVAVDNESAYELLQKRRRGKTDAVPVHEDSVKTKSGRQTPFEAFISSAARAVGSQVGRAIIRGIMNSIIRNR